jgi:Ca-activated chloride channel homolog
MTFNYYKYLPILIVLLLLFIIFIVKQDKNYFKFIKDYWFVSQSKSHKLGTFFYLVAVSLLLLSLLDLRGPEEIIETSIPNQKTIILIDSSRSMLAEDVLPSRYLRSILLAKHFVKNSYGHNVMISIFSDYQKRIVPFTDDIDLLDARLDGLKEFRQLKGGSNIVTSIQEAASYFKLSKNPTGNIIVLTDGEYNDDRTQSLNLAEGINIAFLVVGTRQGSEIPIREKDGSLRRYFRHNNSVVTTKSSPDWVNSLIKNNKSSRVFEVNSNEIPTQKLIEFLNSQFNKFISNGLIRNRPVLAHYIIFLSFVFMIFAFFLKNRNIYTAFSYIALSFFSSISYGEITKEEVTQKALSYIKKNKYSVESKRKMTELLLRQKVYQKSLVIFKELEEINALNNKKDKFNYATSLMLNAQYEDGLNIFNELIASEKKLSIPDQNFITAIKKNILLSLKNNKQQKQSKSSPDDGDSGQSEGGEGQPSNNDGNDNKNNANPSHILKKQQEKRKIEKRMKRVPSMIKQLLNGDRALQRSFLDTTNKKIKAGGARRDW